MAHVDAPEQWDGRRLVDGGKHYGHLEVNVSVDAAGRWQAELQPVYVFPLMDDQGQVTGWERRVYDDVVVLADRPNTFVALTVFLVGLALTGAGCARSASATATRLSSAGRQGRIAANR